MMKRDSEFSGPLPDGRVRNADFVGHLTKRSALDDVALVDPIRGDQFS
jgi:hypothetical protein